MSLHLDHFLQNVHSLSRLLHCCNYWTNGWCDEQAGLCDISIEYSLEMEVTTFEESCGQVFPYYVMLDDPANRSY